MSNLIDFYMDVLANGPDELQRIEKALHTVSIKLLAGDAGPWIQRIEESTKDVKDLVRFRPASRIGYVYASRSKARRFTNSCEETFRELIMRHVRITSEQFPRAVFLAEYWAIQQGYTSKIVIRTGDVICWVLDGHQQAKGYAWALPDIFAPYRAEHDNGQEFGRLQNRWHKDMCAALADLQRQSSASLDAPSL